MGFKRFSILVLLLLLLSVFMGSVVAQDPVTLVLWHAKQDAEGDGLLALIDAYNAQADGVVVEQVYNPSGTIEDSYRTAAGAGEGPDMIFWANNNSGEWARANIVLDISDAITDDLQGQVADSGWGTFTFEGGVYGVPIVAKTLAFFYNKSLILDAPETWQDVLDISADLASSEGIAGINFQNGFFHSAGFLYALGGSLMDEEGNAAFEPGTEGFDAMVEYLTFHQMMYQLSQDPGSGVLVNGDSPVPGFQDQTNPTVTMVYDGIWNLAQYEQDLGDDLGVALMPALDNGNVPAMFAQTDGIYPNATLGSDEAKLNAYIDFMTFLTGEEGQQIGLEQAGWLPVNPNVSIEGNENLGVFAEQFTLGTPFPNRAELNAFWGPMGDAIAAVGAGGEDPVDVATQAYETIQES
ncbi:MAG: extracellular solute-binding protein, partial [Anaerolineae bacterium]|nr:extracellular solute-binding protein [Anaerolineae bacterium]